MTDQTESASEYAELLRSLDRADRIYGDGLSRKAAAAIRALEAKVREQSSEIVRLMDVQASAMDSLRADRDRLAGEVERLNARHEHARRFDSLDVAQAEVARLTSELAAARENEARYLWLREAEWPMNVWAAVTHRSNAIWDQVIDAARRAGEGEK